MSLPPVASIIQQELTSAGFNLNLAAAETVGFADSIADQLKIAIQTWASTVTVNTSFLHMPGPVMNIIVPPLSSVALVGLPALIDAALRPMYNPTHMILFDDFIVPYVINPISGAINTMFTAWASSAVGAFGIFLGVGVFVDPPLNTIVQVTFTPGIPLFAASNFTQPLDTTVKGLAVAALGGLTNVHQIDLYAYYGAISKACKVIMDAVPSSMFLTPVVPLSVAPVTTPGSAVWAVTLS